MAASQLDRIEVILMQNRNLLLAIAEVLQLSKDLAESDAERKIYRELDRAVVEAKPWRGD